MKKDTGFEIDIEIDKYIQDFDIGKRLAIVDYSKTISLDQFKKFVKQVIMINATQIPMTSSFAQKALLPKDNAARNGKFNGINYAIEKTKQLIKYANNNFVSPQEMFEKLAIEIDQCKKEYIHFRATDNKTETIRKFNDLQMRTYMLIYFWTKLEGHKDI